jgi:hypothetical protein
MTETENSFDKASFQSQNVYQPHYNPPTMHGKLKRNTDKKQSGVKVKTKNNH